MSAEYTGGPAFPVPGHTDGWHPKDGMTLRDYFAGQALSGLLANHGIEAYITIMSKKGGSAGEAVPQLAYTLADYMLAQRSKP
jgi:hypothetical protein